MSERPVNQNTGMSASTHILDRCRLVSPTRKRAFRRTRGAMRSATPLATSLAILFLFAPVAAYAQPLDPEHHFVQDVLPLLAEKCFACHGDQAQELRGGLDLRSRPAMLRGGDRGQAAIEPGDADQSPLYLAVTREDAAWSPMPPKENDRLTPSQQHTIAEWIRAGAVWPSAERIAQLEREAAAARPSVSGERVDVRAGLTSTWTNRTYDPDQLWAYRPLSEMSPGADIDRLIATKLEQAGLAPAPLADRRTLIRRATFDLLGLPPTAAEIQAFVDDSTPDEIAFARLVDRLLASPHYGEQWGRRWLDVVRYADSAGLANDYERGNAWRYRDYVVHSWNQDVPYDRMVRDQIAGDEINPSDPERLIAVGLLRMGPWELTGMEVAKVARQRFLDDVTDLIGQVFLGHMLQCARCHDHKFDPVPTRDYYSLQAVFATTQIAERDVPFLEREAPLDCRERTYLLERRESYGELHRELDAYRFGYARQRLRDDPATWQAMQEARETLAQASGVHGEEVGYGQVYARMIKQGWDPSRVPKPTDGFQAQQYGLERVARKGLERLRWSLDRYEPRAHSVYSGLTPELKAVYAPLAMPENPESNGTREQTAVLIGGDPFSPADKVLPGVLSAPVSLGAMSRTNRDVTDNLSGRRSELAAWITAPDNPLTARVLANRLWQGHFGKAIAASPNNLGATGKPPTHPELLDYLAQRLIQQGWSIKAMHRLIMNSETYRRSSEHPDPEQLDRQDPQRELYAVFVPRRLDAEELRDARLAATGELNRQLGGVPIRPEIHPEVALQPRMVMGTFAEAWQPSPLPAQRHRRSIYVQRVRGLRHPFLEVFNAPAGETSCEARESSIVTPQVFALFNSEFAYDRALAMAARLLADADADTSNDNTFRHASDLAEDRTAFAADVVHRAFLDAFGRKPSEDEQQRALTHWQQMTRRHAAIVFRSTEYPKEVTREAVEENTGELFTFREPLEVYRDFVPDRKPADCSPRMRGLAELCLVLMNAHEFVYVY